MSKLTRGKNKPANTQCNKCALLFSFKITQYQMSKLTRGKNKNKPANTRTMQ